MIEMSDLKVHVEYIRLPKKYKSANWGMDIISVRLPPQLNAELEKLAIKMRVTKSELIRTAIAKYLQEVKDNV